MKIILTARQTGSALYSFLLTQLKYIEWINCSGLDYQAVKNGSEADLYINVLEGNTLGEVIDICAFFRNNKKKSITVSSWNNSLVTGPTHFPGKSAGADSAILILHQEYGRPADKLDLKSQITSTVSSNDVQGNPDIVFAAFASLLNELKILYNDKPAQRLNFVDGVRLFKLHQKDQAIYESKYIYPIFDSADTGASHESLTDYKVLVGKFSHSVTHIKNGFFNALPPENGRDEYQNVAIIGGGTAGYLTALLFKEKYPNMPVTLIESSKIPVIGVGEATTPEIRSFLFGVLKFSAHEFYEIVKPTWKLGIKFFWGLPGDYYFNYPFGWPDVKSSYVADGDINNSSLTATLMDQESSFVVAAKDGSGAQQYSTLSDELFYALHLDNVSFIKYLKIKAQEKGIIYIDDLIVGAERKADSDELAVVIGETGKRHIYDFYVDCTGFSSLLLEKTLKSEFISYNKSLFCDTAVVGNIPGVNKIKTYTYAESMDHGWCWNIPMRGEDHRGYVFSSAYCSIDEATDEFLRKNPEISNPGIVRFKTGRHREICIGNVFAIGNSFAFVEPLESTGIHMIITEAKRLVNNFSELKGSPALRKKINTDINDNWDYLRDFLAIHYKFNKKFDTRFWKDCRALTDVSGIQDMIDLYHEIGLLSCANKSLVRMINSSIKDVIFGLVGFDVMMMGQGEIPKKFDWSVRNQHIWKSNVETWKAIRSLTVPVDKDLDILNEYLESRW